MSTQSLKYKRQKLIAYISAHLNETPMALLLNFPGFLLPKAAGFSITTNTVILGVLVALPTFLTALVLDEMDKIKPTEWLGILVVLEGFCISNYIAYFNVNRFIRDIQYHTIDSMTSPRDLDDLQKWLSLGWNGSVLKKYLLLWTICLFPIGYISLRLVYGNLQIYSLYVWLITFIILSGMTWSFAPLNMLLSIRLSRYEYSLNDVDPAHSMIVRAISKNLNNYTYGYAINAAMVQLIFAAVGQFFLFGITAAFIAWIPVIAQFVLNQTGMQHIIVTSKWKTMLKIQSQIRQLQTQDMLDKDNIETIMKMMDYHDRIKGTPNSVLNIKSFLDLSSQLAIPSLGFILANIDKIIDFLT